MRKLVLVLGVMLSGLIVGIQPTAAQDAPRESVDIFLDDEQLDVEADIPSVELVLTFKGLHYESIELKKTFLPELLETIEHEPF